MTNRFDAIDKAFLRDGRFSVVKKISLPDEKGRLQILRIHTATMRTNLLLADDVDLQELAVETPNFSGADISALVKTASGFALDRRTNVSSLVWV
jgi:vesicle-fusing ATPase